ncbi:hypothetical protein AWC23_08705 [Mycobacterium saskatchewanense]|uniref:ABM domain-containing protein n=2 Tax=Mycobacterium saskatchewanense TaxID=220927 RepID=A0AAJ3NSA3_9MYCO|nr:hypothetical protein AWC23_08705 [Mycobacterium saskatchewanense]
MLWVEFEVDDPTEFAEASRAVRDSVARNEPGISGYDWYWDDSRGRCHVLEIYDTSQAFIDHVKGEAAVVLLPGLERHAKLVRVEVHGCPSEKAKKVLIRNGGIMFHSM